MFYKIIIYFQNYELYRVYVLEIMFWLVKNIIFGDIGIVVIVVKEVCDIWV